MQAPEPMSFVPAWPLHLRHANARAELRRTRFAWTAALVTRDVSMVAIVGVIVLLLMWVSR